MPQNWDMRRIETEEHQCPECGGQVNGGRGGCQALFDEMTYLISTDSQIASVHRLALDTYCMQHVESYCASAKSYVAHLIGLHWGINHLDDPAPYAPIQRILDQTVKLVKPPVLRHRGSITFPDVIAPYRSTRNSDDLVRNVHSWANNVWEAYASQHDIVQIWLK